MRSNSQTIRHAKHDGVPPLIDENCTVLILGSMLSPKSAEQRFYYAHPQNRFWRVFAAIYECECPTDNKRKAEFALAHRTALWDVLASCDIIGASDSTIDNVVYNDIVGILNEYPKITRIFTTGSKAHELLMRYNKSFNNPIIAQATRLPSTSPLNCAATLDRLIEAYKIIK